ncbi:MAG: Ankyrin [Acidobacteriales bacterium]|nr:Ankyrin [Terriglobales bacterium]
MYPNPQDVIPLPPRPNLEQYRKQAKDLVRACKYSDSDAINKWATQWVPELAHQIQRFAQTELSKSCSLTTAQFILARAHGFPSWPKFSEQIQALARANSPISQFELAADAIITGNIPNLKRLLIENPELVRVRSAREHHATLLHYVAANGVENHRQKTPKNIVEVTALLLDSGADVNAEAEMYGGGSTTLGLAATSVHPERAGVQLELMKLLMDHGAIVSANQRARGAARVRACLHNGRKQAAEFLAQYSNNLDLEEAAGVGNLDAVRTFFNSDNTLKPPATKLQMEDGFCWACQFGHINTVELLLDKGVDISADGDTGQTGLHMGVIGTHLDIINLLLKRGASLETKNSYGGTALGQATWSAIHDPTIDYAPVIQRLLEAGADITQADYPTGKKEIDDLLRKHGAHP